MASCHARSNWRFPSAGHLPLASSQKADFCFGRADPESADRYAHVVVSEQARRADLLPGATKKVG
jgi:hypothetical protein